jgi:hypothetical protein
MDRGSFEAAEPIDDQPAELVDGKSALAAIVRDDARTATPRTRGGPRSGASFLMETDGAA